MLRLAVDVRLPSDLGLEPRHRAVAQPHSSSNPVDSCPSAQQFAGSLNFGCAFGIDFNGSAAQNLAVGHRSLQASVDALSDHRTLELSKGTRNLEHQFAGWCGRVDALLVEVQIDAAVHEMLNRAE